MVRWLLTCLVRLLLARPAQWLLVRLARLLLTRLVRPKAVLVWLGLILWRL